MDFQLLDNYTPNTITHIEDLINSGTYNTNATFYRVLQNFMDQGGIGSAGTGSTIPVEVNPDLRFTSSGLLAMANNGVDGNSSEFFITNPDSSLNGFLDFRYTIFGKLVEGDGVRQDIANVPVKDNGATPPETSQPTTPIDITSVSILPSDTQDGVFMLKAQTGASGSYTVTVTDGHGGTQDFTVHVGFTGPVTLSTGSTTTKQIAFDSADLTTTASNIQSALSAAGLSGTVTVDPASTAMSFRFHVAFGSSQSAPDGGGDGFAGHVLQFGLLFLVGRRPGADLQLDEHERRGLRPDQRVGQADQRHRQDLHPVQYGRQLYACRRPRQTAAR